jgi:hypothetical protein
MELELSSFAVRVVVMNVGENDDGNDYTFLVGAGTDKEWLGAVCRINPDRTCGRVNTGVSC